MRVSQEDTSASGRPVKYVVHRYINGATCHLTGQPRTAEVRYTCLRDSKENLIASVREFPTCNYVVLPEDSRLISCVPLGGAGQGQAEAEAFDSSGKGSGGGGSSGIGGDAEPVADKAAATAGAAASASQQDQQQAAAARPSPEAAAGVDGGGLQAGGAVDGGSKGGGGAAEAGAMGRDEL
ncbi:hypothetical protein MNEG_8726 [Monoraphidium neglectum]|uniref:MRH domain-containing protein n=1 Tax=Monoraphidium neglectum TaxID=145388 RepID=A0A0D2M797_9CHLO|nr:hypothetical protein MNEG_8726 [Monoraphidium neglectum]KIY99234.1 hypothetical protein MNEG_8726 [Monoraphidium neglectum]|eukprot:XP_013898254.1 hypothetical protein MNEG_8726 [Monoraphidium neglectum]